MKILTVTNVSGWFFALFSRNAATLAPPAQDEFILVDGTAAAAVPVPVPEVIQAAALAVPAEVPAEAAIAEQETIPAAALAVPAQAPIAEQESIPAEATMPAAPWTFDAELNQSNISEIPPAPPPSPVDADLTQQNPNPSSRLLLTGVMPDLLAPDSEDGSNITPSADSPAPSPSAFLATSISGLLSSLQTEPPQPLHIRRDRPGFTWPKPIISPDIPHRLDGSDDPNMNALAPSVPNVPNVPKVPIVPSSPIVSNADSLQSDSAPKSLFLFKQKINTTAAILTAVAIVGMAVIITTEVSNRSSNK